MTKFKRIVSAVLSLAFVPATMVSASTASTITASVSRTESDKQTYTENKVSLMNFYDYGTWLIGDDAYISATVKTGSNPYAYIYYKPYGSGSWSYKGGSGYTSVYANPSGCDYLQSGSYALSKSGSAGIRLNVTN